MSTTAALIDPEDGFDTPPGSPVKKEHRGVRCVIVTPEATILDEHAEFVALPLYDGELGVLPGRAPVIGRLGYGELRIRTGEIARRFFVDGGFAQIRDDVVTVLTSRAFRVDQIDADAARSELDSAKSRRATTDLDQVEKQRAEDRARALLRLSGRGTASPAR
ncbi:ATP synthase F1 subunit epsilon [Tautonia plasticadhaerens]|uniref:ATP synthase epsilon chain n=1 Tax=Tautonia plasticadhaerens TaxID=2527974 RepID=A0A518H8A0_9BACT|nr:ATP synthase F1 subunit epsilon [Tautonia plasticadhaerens]QDV37045.1 ATP synthase epsilon chain [Tautonia plasticadhaerens]